MPMAFAIFLAVLTVASLEAFTEGSHFASRDTSPPALSACISPASVDLMYSSAACSQGVPISTRMSSYLPYSAMLAIFFITVSGSASARYFRITLKNLLSPRPPLISLAKKSVLTARSLSSANALTNLLMISSSEAWRSAPAVAKRSRQKDSVLMNVTAPFSVNV